MSSAPVKRACDSCHRRKVKCISEGIPPCKNCATAGLNCTYNTIPLKKGPKGSRAKVLSELRETQQRQTQPLGSYHDLGLDNQPLSPSLARTPGLLTPTLVNNCVEFYFANLYPTQPILHRHRVTQTVMSMDQSVEAYCMVAALCAYVLMQPNMIAQRTGLPAEAGQMSNTDLGLLVLEELTRVRKGYNYMENPTRLSVTTSYFLYICYYSLDKHNLAWFHLREATTHAQLLGMHDEETYKIGDFIETSRRRRLFWALFINERVYALQRHRPLTLQATIQLPSADEDPTETIPLTGFIHLINLYKPFDNTFIGLWNKVRTGCLPSWLAQLQSELADALPAYLEGPETQAVDLRTSQQWLKTMVWQLAISHGFISSVATDPAMCFKYPIEISRDLTAMTSQFSQQAMEVHGVGLIEKLYDVACTLTDVMACVPIDEHTFQHTFELRPRDYLNQFLTLISTLRGGQERYLPMLLAKISEVFPNRPLPTFPAPAPASSQVSDPYDSPASVPQPLDAKALPYESPRDMPIRHGSHGSLHYTDSTTPPMAPTTHPYATYPAAMGYPEVTTATPAPAIYQAQHHFAHPTHRS